jgi:glycosyltransferase involved in cell wall biosynthesis
LRAWDQIASSRPDKFVAISQNVASRIKKYYQRASEIIYPPVDLNKFKMKSPEYKIGPADYDKNYFLIVSRLVPYKRIDIAVEAFNKLGLFLKIIGSGVEEEKLKSKALPNIEFLGQDLTDLELLDYYQNCRAIIFPGEEDFGLVPIEAQACGKPVIAFGGGGVLESVVSGVTGEFFFPQTPQSLIRALEQFKEKRYKANDCRKNAQKFSQEIFKEKFKESLK